MSLSNGLHPRNAQALARHSTIDLTMNPPALKLRRAGVYTHVAMADLHDDVESLPGLTRNGTAEFRGIEAGAMTANTEPAHAPDVLAGLISSWNDLPTNIRSAIAALASA